MLALSGCGGGGSTAAPPGTDPDPATPVAVDLTGVADDAMVEAGTVEIAAGESADVGEVTFMCAAGGAACSVEVTVGEDGSVSAMATGGMVTASDSAAYTARKAEEAAAMVAAATKAAASKRTAIEEEAAQTEDAGIGGSTAPAAGKAGAYSMTIERDGDGTTVKITLQDAADDDPKFMQEMDMMDGRTMHVLEMEADNDNVVEEVVIVSTDIEAPTATDFAKEYTLNANPTEGGDNQSLNITGENFTNIATMGLTGPGEGERTFLSPVEDDATTEEDESVEGFETDATYNGAPGKLTCAGTSNCKATIGQDGKISSMGGEWQFTPAEGAMVDVADDDYLHYGVWLKKTTDADGAVTYDEVQTFAGSSVDASGSIAAVTGSATYTGGAVGVYVREVYKTEDGSVDTATSGHFKADVSLKATFGQVLDDQATPEGTIAPNLLDTLTGTIDNFMLSADGEAMNTWSVELDGDINDSNGTATGTTTVGEDTMAGTFNATFHGAVGTGDEIVAPHSVVGEFDAKFGNGLVAGGFGARQDKE